MPFATKGFLVYLNDLRAKTGILYSRPTMIISNIRRCIVAEKYLDNGKIAVTGCHTCKLASDSRLVQKENNAYMEKQKLVLHTGIHERRGALAIRSIDVDSSIIQ